MKHISKIIVFSLFLILSNCSEDDSCNCLYSNEFNQWMNVKSAEELKILEENKHFLTQEQLDEMDRQCKARGC